MDAFSASRVSTKLGDGLWRVSLPVPFGRLGDVNVYLLEDADGWTVFDAGLNWPDAREAWYAVAEETGMGPGDLTRIVLTHTHPDHVGLAGWLQREARAAGRRVPVLLSEEERDLLPYWFEGREETRREVGAMLRRCGAPSAFVERGTGDLEQMRRAVHPLPDSVEIVAPGDVLRVGTRAFEAIHTPGHSNGHLVFYDRAARLLLVGDQVLAGITPNVSQWPVAGPDPLGQYLGSLRALAALDVRRALPGHGPPISDWPGRLHEIRRHHDERLDTARGAVEEEDESGGATVLAVARRLFDMDALAVGEARFALAETLAHLSYLVRRGEVRRLGSEGVWRYRCPR